ncbi:MAG: hypothetical protein Q4E55_03655 [Bacteroidales bacterium]|nr:hypothetical protein [Bacteroidales bacterium]
MAEEEELLRKVGRENHYRVPEHYFEDFTARLMDSLPIEENPVVATVPLWRRVVPWVSVAAVVVGVVLLIQPFPSGTADFSQLNITQEQIRDMSDEEVEGVIESSLLDGYALYEYLTDATQY